MKIKVDAKALKQAVKAAQTLQNIGSESKSKDDPTFKGRLKVIENFLVIDTSAGGAYVQKKVPGTTLRPGEVGVDLNTLDKCRLTGEVTVEYNEDKRQINFFNKKSRYELAVDQEAAINIEQTKPTDQEIPVIAKLPAELLAHAAGYVALKPTLKVEDMRLQVRLVKAQNIVELIGLDNYSYGRYCCDGTGVKLKKDAQFTLKSASLGTILNSVTGTTVELGVQMDEAQQDVKLVRFRADDTDVFYPALDVPFQNPDEVKKVVTSGTLNAAFTFLRKNMREALATVKTVSTNASIPLLLNIRVDGKSVKMAAMREGNTSVAKIAVTNIEIPDGGVHMIYLNQHYFETIMNLAPDVVPMRIEAWNNASVLIKTANVEKERLEYFMDQVDLALLEEQLATWTK